MRVFLPDRLCANYRFQTLFLENLAQIDVAPATGCHYGGIILLKINGRHLNGIDREWG